MKRRILHDFSAHRTELKECHRAQIADIAAEIKRSFDGKRHPVRCLQLIGHAATWRNLSKDEYGRRALARAQEAAELLSSSLETYGLIPKIFLENELEVEPVSGIHVALFVGGRADDQPLHPNLTNRTDSVARKNRALNRRVKITHIATPTPQPSCTDLDIAKAIRDMDLEKELAAREERRFRSRVHREAVLCISRKLVSAIVDGDRLDDKFIARWTGLRSSTRPRPVWIKFKDELKKDCDRRGLITENDFINVYNTLAAPIENIIPLINSALGGVTPNPFGGPSTKEIKKKIAECRAVKPIYERSNDRESIYWCLRRWTRPALNACFV